jgi:hypothetical protein
MKETRVMKLTAMIFLAFTNAAVYFYFRHLLIVTGDIGIPPRGQSSRTVLALLFSGLTLLSTGTAFFCAKTLAKSTATRFILCLASLAMFGIALAVPSIGSVDNFWNVLMARGMVVYGKNPYMMTAGSFAKDPVFAYTAPEWSGNTMVYGPIWTAISAIPVVLTQSVAEELVYMRMLNVVGYLLAGIFLFRFLKKRGDDDAWLFLAFWLCNPFAVFEIANAGHNEGAMLPFLALIAIALFERKLMKAAVAVVGAALVKHWPIIIAPALLAIPAKNRDRLKAVLISTFTLAAFWGIFWRGFKTIASIVQNGNARNHVYYFSPFRLLAWVTAFSAGAPDPTAIAHQLSFLSFLAIIAAVTWLALRKKLQPLMAALLIISAYHFVWLNWLQPWYLLAFGPFILMLFKTRSAVAIIATVGIIGFFMYPLPPALVSIPVLTVFVLFVATRGWERSMRLLRTSQREYSTTAPTNKIL